MKDEYLVYTSGTHDTFYFKNGKLHREDGPAIVCRKDKSKKNFEGLKDEALYTRVSEPVEQNDDMLFYIIHCDSSYYYEGVRYNNKQEMSAILLKKELNNNVSQVTNNDSKKMKI